MFEFLKEPVFLAVVLGTAGGVAGFYLPQFLTYNIDVPAPSFTKKQKLWRLKGLFLYSILGIFAAVATTLKLALPDNTYNLGLANLMFIQFCVGISGPQVLVSCQKLGIKVYSFFGEKPRLEKKEV